MAESQSQRMEEEEKIGKETDCRIRGRKSAWRQGFVSWLFPKCRSPQSCLTLAESWRWTGERAVQKQYGGSRSICRARRLQCWLISYLLIALSSCDLLSSPSQRKGWIILQQLPLQHLGSVESRLCLARSSAVTAAPRARDAPAIPHHGCIQGGCLIVGTVLVPPTAVVLALIQAVGLSNMDNPVHSSLLPPI